MKLLRLRSSSDATRDVLATDGHRSADATDFGVFLVMAASGLVAWWRAWTIEEGRDDAAA